MSKRSQKALASATILSLVLSTVVAMPAKAAATAGTAIGGSDRVATSVEIGKKAYATWTTSKTAVIAYAADANLVDALTVAPLAYKKSAPIFLTNSKTALEAGILDTLKAQKVDTVYIAGGLVNKEAVAKQLADAGLTVTVKALAGANRFETAAAINTELGATTSVAVVNGDAVIDALSVAAVAAHDGMAIVLSGKDALPVGTTVPAGTTVYAIGGAGVVSDSLVSSLGATRLGGATRYATNAAVLTGLDASLDFGTVYMANGAGLGVDALPGSVLAAQTKSPIVLADTTLDASVNTVLASKAGKVTNIVPLGMNVNASAIDAAKAAVTTGDLAVESVSAVTANSMKVVLTSAPADTSKVTFTVLRATTPVTVTATWNADKTEATLTGSSNFAEGTYSVAVKNDTTDLGSSDVTISQQKIAKINITSTKLGVVTVGGVQTGYANYNVLDQYGNDITKSSYGNNLTFQTGVGTATGRNGLITVTPAAGLNFMTFTSGIVLTANDTNSGVSTSSTLAATSQVGTLSDISLTKLTNVDNKVLTAGDATDVFYAEFTATDISGNPTTNYTLVKQGLILQAGDYLTTSSPNVTAQLVSDPTDSTKALIEVKASSATITLDMPVVITAMTWTGKTSQLNVTLKKQAALDSLTLMAPAYDIASNESKVIPFVAVDQDGNTLTKYSKIVPYVTFNGVTPYENVDGTLTLKNVAVPNAGTTSIPEVLTATTQTGKYSTITVNIQKTVKADALALDSSVFVTSMQTASTEKIDFGYDAGGLALKDQYGRAIDMTGGSNNYVVVPTSNSASVSVAGTASVGQNQITLTAGAAGSATITFSVYDSVVDPGHVSPIDQKSVSFTVVQNSDINGYTIDAVASPIYAGIAYGAAITGRDSSYDANPCVYGTTSTGSKIMLANNPVIAASIDSSNFAIDGTLNTYDSVNVIATKPTDTTKTEATGTLAVTIRAYDNSIHSVTTTIKSTTVAPVVSSVVAYANTSVAGTSVDGDTITTNVATLATTKSIARFDGAGSSANRASIYIYALDQYGKKATAMQFVKVNVGDANELTDAEFNVTADGTITGTGAVSGKHATISAYVGGFVKTIKVIFN